MWLPMAKLPRDFYFYRGTVSYSFPTVLFKVVLQTIKNQIGKEA